MEVQFSSHSCQWPNSASIILSTEEDNSANSDVFMVYFQLLSLIWAGAKNPISSLKANSPLLSYSASSSGSFPARLNSHSGERKRVKGDLRTETFVLHSKLSQAQRLDLDVVCITDQRKSFFCQLHVLMEHHFQNTGSARKEQIPLLPLSLCQSRKEKSLPGQ